MLFTITEREPHEILITGALIADGTGAPLKVSDLLITGDLISALESPGVIPNAPNRQIIHAEGLVIAPGFIDVHSHADISPLLEEDDTTKILQGVTTEVVGNCGSSMAPLVVGREGLSGATVGRLFPDVPMPWHGFGEMLTILDGKGYVTNYCPLVGHGALRIAAVGAEARGAAPAELKHMQLLLEQALAEGAFGLSSGLIYPPGTYSDTDELAQLAAVLSPSRVYSTHMRGESDTLLDSIEEAIAVGVRSSCRVQVSHLKSAGRENWGKAPQALRRLDKARDDGLRITQDLYPYAAASTTLTACLPPWSHDGGDQALLERISDPATVSKLRYAVEQGDAGGWDNLIRGAGYDGIMVASTVSHEFEGRTLTEIGALMGVDPFDAMVAVLRAEHLRVSMVEFSMYEEDIEAIMVNDSTLIASDGLPTGTGGKAHPRLYGTFPRVLGRYVRERGVLDLSSAVHKMTGLPAEVFGLAGRGVVERGAVADLVAFNATEITDVGTYQDPAHAPAGIHWVMQAGMIVVEDGRWLGRRAGSRLSPS